MRNSIVGLPVKFSYLILENSSNHQPGIKTFNGSVFALTTCERESDQCHCPDFVDEETST